MSSTVEPFPNKKYAVIYADPPWSYNDKMAGHSFSLDHEYETQDKEWIAKLPVQSISEKDSVLFLWAVSPMLPEAIEVMRAWGYKYKTVGFVWSKQTVTGKRVSNLGRWTMGNVEVVLVGTRGKPQRCCKNIKQFVESVRRKHSQKPDQVAERITELMGDVPRIELFSRSNRVGWDSWGDQTGTI